MPKGIRKSRITREQKGTLQILDVILLFYYHLFMDIIAACLVFIMSSSFSWNISNKSFISEILPILRHNDYVWETKVHFHTKFKPETKCCEVEKHPATVHHFASLSYTTTYFTLSCKSRRAADEIFNFVGTSCQRPMGYELSPQLCGFATTKRKMKTLVNNQSTSENARVAWGLHCPNVWKTLFMKTEH